MRCIEVNFKEYKYYNFISNSRSRGNVCNEEAILKDMIGEVAILRNEMNEKCV